MWAAHLLAWKRAETQEGLSDPSNCVMVIRLIQVAFRESPLTEECAWKTAVLIPKGNGNFRNIVTVERLWKTVMEILNCRFAAEIQLNDTLHVFPTGRGTKTTFLEAKLIQQLLLMM